MTSELETISKQAKSLFDALTISERNFVVILPNNDPGCNQIKEEIEKLDKKRFKVLPSMRFNFFSELIKNCSIFIGNSSAGVRELPFLGIYSLDIGTRQLNRSINESIKTINPLDQKNILLNIEAGWNKKFKKSFGYGNGNAAELFVKKILSEDIWKNSLQKNFRDFL